MLTSVQAQNASSRRASAFEARLVPMMFLWVVMLSFASGLRMAFAVRPVRDALDYVFVAAPYVLMIAVPVVAMAIALRRFPAGVVHPQPRFRLAVIGRWRSVDPIGARSDKLFGPRGIMLSLLAGILLNIPVRAIEFLVAVPAAGSGAPHWYGMLFGVLLGDLLLMSSLYAITFVAALRAVPHFPRMIAAVWMVDLAMQFVIAHLLAHTAGLPPSVAAAISILLGGNLKKVLISAALWTPYLLLSRRVNLTYRMREPA